MVPATEEWGGGHHPDHSSLVHYWRGTSLEGALREEKVGKAVDSMHRGALGGSERSRECSCGMDRGGDAAHTVRYDQRNYRCSRRSTVNFKSAREALRVFSGVEGENPPRVGAANDRSACDAQKVPWGSLDYVGHRGLHLQVDSLAVEGGPATAIVAGPCCNNRLDGLGQGDLESGESVRGGEEGLRG
jgi:hypothetical protein